MMLTGSIPIEVTISSNGYQFMEDWLYCYVLIEKSIRTKNLIKKKFKDDYLKYQRIHGEWLANFSYLYFKKNCWECDLLNIFKDFFTNNNVNPAAMERNIRLAETQIILKSTNRKIKHLIKIN